MLKSPSSPRKMRASSYYYNSIKMLGSACFCLLLLAGCNSVNPNYTSEKSHHARQGFKNNCGASVTWDMGDFLLWQYKRTRAGLPKPSKTLTAVVPPDLAAARVAANILETDFFLP